MIKIRKFANGDEFAIAEVIAKTLYEVNIKDETKEQIEEVVEHLNSDTIRKRAESFHMYVIVDLDRIIGVGAIGPYWDSLTESNLFNIFILPDYQGKGLGRKLIEVLESDEYFKRADRVEIPASMTAVEFYRHMGYGFKKFGNIVDEDLVYRLEKFPKISSNNNDIKQYNMRPFIDNEYHNYYEFVYQCKKEIEKEQIIIQNGKWDEEEQRCLYEKFIKINKNNIYIIQLNGTDIGFYNGYLVNVDTYEVGNIFVLEEYRDKGIEAQILVDILELYRDKDIYVKYFKQNKGGNLYERLGFVLHKEEEDYCEMVRFRVNKKYVSEE